MIRTIACDPGIKAFGVMDNNRLVYVHENGAGWLVLKCIQYSSTIRCAAELKHAFLTFPRGALAYSP